MKYIPAVLLLTVLLVSSAGCISLGTQTTDIVMGNETVGHIYVTPVTDNLLSNESVTEKFDITVELFGFTFTKEGVTQSETEDIIGTLSSVNTTDTSSLLDLGFIPSLDELSPDDPDDFLHQILTMPVTNLENEAALDSIDFDGAGARIQASAERIANLLGLA
ncbi:hypothetical protein Mlab_0220 [Methanocorpusculum labreanum Z]|uniref:Lipoprotein n=1 Tax=Methanocorpusculum labreanum (strain ATCC 43576 / DSM 4855 / Z) TaxID=410358 RepID=A2SPZ0_METLZ|nr:hypothetical protein [Methanocorpusculum labreanum]ABN06396.1 hypothetical protein Mlab_0220 [Methanocorpusculum labreanum Z]